MKNTTKIFTLIVLFSLVACSHYSNGLRTGELIKFSRKGIMFKTWEGTINLGGMVRHSDGKGNSSMVANTWDFSIDESAHRGENIQGLADTLNLAIELGYRIKVHYNQEVGTNCSCKRGSEEYFVDKVQIIRN